MYGLLAIVSLAVHSIVFCVHLSLLNKHTGSISSVADPSFPADPRLAAVLVVYQGGHWHSLLCRFALEVICERS